MFAWYRMPNDPGDADAVQRCIGCSGRVYERGRCDVAENTVSSLVAASQERSVHVDVPVATEPCTGARRGGFLFYSKVL